LPLAWEELTYNRFPQEKTKDVHSAVMTESAKMARSGRRKNKTTFPVDSLSKSNGQLSLIDEPPAALSEIEKIRQQIANQIANLEAERTKLDNMEREEKERQAALKLIEKRKNEQFSGEYFSVTCDNTIHGKRYRVRTKRTKTGGINSTIFRFEELKDANKVAMKCESVLLSVLELNEKAATTGSK
jgi:hypothetical protein